MNASAGHRKPCGEPHMARGPLFAHPCLKTYLRSSTGNERMTGLALLYIHKDRQIDREKIMNDFVANSNRRSDFVL